MRCDNTDFDSYGDKAFVCNSKTPTNFMILDNVVPDSPKTSEFIGMLKNLKLEGKKITVLTEKMEENLYLGSRNIKNICVVPAQSASA